MPQHHDMRCPARAQESGCIRDASWPDARRRRRRRQQPAHVGVRSYLHLGQKEGVEHDGHIAEAVRASARGASRLLPLNHVSAKHGLWKYNIKDASRRGDTRHLSDANVCLAAVLWTSATHAAATRASECAYPCACRRDNLTGGTCQSRSRQRARGMRKASGVGKLIWPTS